MSDFYLMTGLICNKMYFQKQYGFFSGMGIFIISSSSSSISWL